MASLVALQFRGTLVAQERGNVGALLGFDGYGRFFCDSGLFESLLPRVFRFRPKFYSFVEKGLFRHKEAVVDSFADRLQGIMGAGGNVEKFTSVSVPC